MLDRLRKQKEMPLVRRRSHDGDTRWLFRRAVASRPIGEQALSCRIKQIGVECNQARRAALLHLAGRLPAAIAADLLGLHVATTIQRTQIAGRPWTTTATSSRRPSLRDSR